MKKFWNLIKRGMLKIKDGLVTGLGLVLITIFSILATIIIPIVVVFGPWSSKDIMGRVEDKMK